MTRSASRRANRNARKLVPPFSFADRDTYKFTVDSMRRFAGTINALDGETNWLLAISRANQRLRDERGEGRVRPRHVYPERFPLALPSGEYRGSYGVDVIRQW